MIVGAGVCVGQGAVLCLAGCTLTGPFAAITAAGAATGAGASALAGGGIGSILSHFGF